MKVLTNNYFHKQLERLDLGPDYLQGVLENVAKGRSIPLGGKLYKIRAAGFSKGKSGGFRNIFFWKRDELIVFCLLFSKGSQENLEPEQFTHLTILARQYEALKPFEIDQLISNNKLWEVKYDKKTAS